MARLPWEKLKWGWARGIDAGEYADIPSLRSLHDSVASDARTFRSALQTWFVVPVFTAYALGVLGLLLVVATFSRISEGPAIWWVPCFFCVFNLSAMLLAVALRQRAWTRRVPFDSRLLHAVTDYRSRIGAVKAKAGTDAAATRTLEEIVREGARDIERLLRSRYILIDGSASQADAAERWEKQLQPVITESTARLLLPDEATDPVKWFDAWSEEVASLYLKGPMAAESSSSADTKMLPADPPAYRKPLLIGWLLMLASAAALTIAVTAHGILPSMESVDLTKIPAALVAMATLGSLAAGWWNFLEGRRRRTGD